MTVVVQDSGRYMVWGIQAVHDGLATGVMLSPFDTPINDAPPRRTAARISSDVGDAGGDLIFDPCTHALELPGCDKFDFYPDWALWGASRDLTDDAVRSEHVSRCFAAADSLSSPRLGPTVAVSSPVSMQANIALHLARAATIESPGCWLAIAGTPDFWNAGRLLDDFVGAIASLRPACVVLTVVRPSQSYPVAATADEVAGLCRTTMALSTRARVIVSHGDFAALPAVAAGATNIGTGWDLGQRAFCPERFRKPSGGGQNVARVTHRGLLASLSGTDPEAIQLVDAQVGEELVLVSQTLDDGELDGSVDVVGDVPQLTVKETDGAYRAVFALGDRRMGETALRSDLSLPEVDALVREGLGLAPESASTPIDVEDSD